MKKKDKASFLSNMRKEYEERIAIYRDHLQQSTQMLVLLNIMFFFLTELVKTHGYYFTYYSLLFLAIIQIALLIPSRTLSSFRAYIVYLVCKVIALYFFISSVVYWIRATNI